MKKITTLVLIAVMFSLLFAAHVAAYTKNEIGCNAAFFGEINGKKVIKYCMPLAENGDAAAQYRVGYVYYYGVVTDKDMTNAVKWISDASYQDYPLAQNLLGVMFETGDGVEQNFEESTKFYFQAARAGLPIAQFNLGRAYELGQGIIKNDKLAITWYKKSADQYYPDAQYNMGMAYEVGNKGVPKNYKIAA